VAGATPGVTPTLARVREALARRSARRESAPEARPAAVALLLWEGPVGLEALFIHRAERAGDPWSGQVAFPGGHAEPGDADLLATAMRETREETGIDLSGADRLGELDDLYPRTPTLPPVVVSPFVFGLATRPPLGSSSEVKRAFWVPLARLSGADVRRVVPITLRGGVRRFPAYAIDGEVIWGMTERILTAFLVLIGVLEPPVVA
jgi:8-oxo-dGTP pyrophosphatase MutT (NUDIX family)